MKETTTEIVKQLKQLTPEEIAVVIQNLEEKCANATLLKHEALPEGNNYALFVWQQNLPPMKTMLEMLRPPELEEEYQRKEPQSYGRTLYFLKMSKNVKELDAIIRREPTHQYVLMKGSMMDVSSMTQVFVDGKNLNTLESEWS